MSLGFFMDLSPVSFLFCGAVNLAARLSPLWVFENVRYAFSNRGYQGHKTKGGFLISSAVQKVLCNIYEVQRIIVMHAYIKPHSTHVELASCMLMMCYFSIHHWLLRLVRLLLKPLKNIQMNSYTLGGPYFSIPYNLLP